MEMLETYVTECEYCPTEVVIPLRRGPWQGWLTRDTFLCDDCYDMINEEDQMRKPKQFKARGYDGVFSPQRKALDIYEVDDQGRPMS